MTSQNTYGRMLREARISAGKTLSQIAEIVGKSIAYISDVEHGTRSALGADDTAAIARALEIPAEPLLRASANARKKIEVRSEDPDLAAIFVGLARAKLSEEDKRKLREIARMKGKPHGK